jgi:CubicO group peptidase (beta-lactamase class C family)
MPIVRPEAVGMSSSQLRLVDKIIQEAITEQHFPGAVVLVARKGKIVVRKAFGDCQWVPESRPMNTSHIFDLASITKPVATATSIMILVERGRLRLWDKVHEFVPDFVPYVDEEGKPGEEACLWHLLTHTSGLPPYANAEEVEKKYGKSIALETLVAHIAGLEKLCPPGKEFHYSCLGFITLSYIAEKVTGKNIAEFAAENIFQPLNMHHTFFTPPKEFHHLCVPTEVIDGKNPLTGVVHDPLARLLGGVSGNAGLFSTADDLAVFAQMLLNRGKYNGVRILGPLTVDRMTEIYSRAAFAGRGWGWDLDSSYSTNQGSITGPSTYGHTGYTGTSVWIDPETETFVILLTNRVHPNDKGEIVAVRSKVANIVASSIDRD